MKLLVVQEIFHTKALFELKTLTKTTKINYYFSVESEYTGSCGSRGVTAGLMCGSPQDYQSLATHARTPSGTSPRLPDITFFAPCLACLSVTISSYHVERPQFTICQVF